MNKLKALQWTERATWLLACVTIAMSIFGDLQLEVVIFSLLAAHHFETMRRLEEMKEEMMFISAKPVPIINGEEVEKYRSQKIYSWNKEEN